MSASAAYAAGSADCALAPGLAPVLAARAVQGVGAALFLPNSVAILGGAFEGAKRGRAFDAAAIAGAVLAVAAELMAWLSAD
ncbi:MAG TPA: hypothetical protein VIJ94_01475 [Caulobacteraceae bacterium]